MPRYSTTCFKDNGHPLMEYELPIEANDGVRFIFQKYRTEMEPYDCLDCGKIHLGLRGKVHDKEHLSCTDSNGYIKDAYASGDDADRQAAFLSEARGIYLSTFYCDTCGYWHLTSRWL